MKKLFFILFSAISFAQEPEIYGTWANQENEFVTIDYDNTFKRFFLKNKRKIMIASGTVEIVDKELRIVRNDTTDNYNLCYYIGKETLVICKPRSTRAWLWQRIGY